MHAVRHVVWIVVELYDAFLCDAYMPFQMGDCSAPHISGLIGLTQYTAVCRCS